MSDAAKAHEQSFQKLVLIFVVSTDPGCCLILNIYICGVQRVLNNMYMF